MSKLPELGLPDVGGFIREQRETARISLRQLAEQAGVSNPYLSQIERGLRKPSAEVLSQIAGALRIATPVMYLRAGLLEAAGSSEVVDAIAADSHLSDKQRRVLTDLYQAFRESDSPAAAAPVDVAEVIEVESEFAARSGGQKPGKAHSGTSGPSRASGSSKTRSKRASD